MRKNNKIFHINVNGKFLDNSFSWSGKEKAQIYRWRMEPVLASSLKILLRMTPNKNEMSYNQVVYSPNIVKGKHSAWEWRTTRCFWQ